MSKYPSIPPEEFLPKLKPLKPLVDAVAAQQGADPHTGGFYTVAMRGIEQHRHSTFPETKFIYAPGGKVSYEQIDKQMLNENTLQDCYYDPAYAELMRDRITRNVSSFMWRKEEKKMLGALLERQVPLKPLLDDIAAEHGAEAGTDFYRAALRYIPSERVIGASGEEVVIFDPAAQNAHSNSRLNVERCYYDPAHRKPLCELITANIEALLRQQAEETARQAEVESAHNAWTATLLPLKPLIDSKAVEWEADTKAPNFYAVAVREVPLSRKMEKDTAYIYGGTTPKAELNEESVKELLYDPARQQDMSVRLDYNISNFAYAAKQRAERNEYNRDLDEQRHQEDEAVSANRTAQAAAIEKITAPGARYIKFEKLLEQAGRSGVECQRLTGRIGDLSQRGGNRGFTFHGRPFKADDVVAVPPFMAKGAQWSNRIDAPPRVYVKYEVAEKLASLIKGSQYRLPTNMPSDWFSNANDFPKDAEDGDKNMRLHPHRRPISR